MLPRIAIAPCRTLPDYEQSVELAGGEPCVLDWTADPVGQVVARYDGLVLPGGLDVQPARYGEAPHPAVTQVSEARDAYEFALVEAALAADLPLLAICRGLQVLNVAAGGTLIQDIPSQVAGALIHAITLPKDAIAHEVRLSPGSRLATLMQEALAGGDTLQVNSRHHQSVRRVANGFTVAATASDIVIEAVEREAARFCIGVQWHPENFWRTGEFRPLFEGLVAASARGARPGRTRTPS